MRLIIDQQPVLFNEGDSILVAMLRADMHPTGGGCLCLSGDCPNCLVTVDGVSYVRSCQMKARPGQVIERHHLNEYPPMPVAERHGAETPAHNVYYDVCVIGASEEGLEAVREAEEAGKRVILLDAEQGQEAVGIYTGPLVVARTDEGMLHVRLTEEVIVATGSAEIQPVVPDSELAGILTSRATEKLSQTDLDLGHIVAVGRPPAGVDCQVVSGDLVRFEGQSKVSAVVVRDENGDEQSYKADTVSVGLGWHPRDALRRMGHDLPVRAVGHAADPSDIPACPPAGMICPCSNVSVADLEYAWESGFHELELVKRATLAGTGTCQGSVCMPYLRSFLAEKGKELQPAFTARPVTRQVTMGEISAGGHHHPTARTALDGEHRKLGAYMDRSGGWWRPWNYGNTDEEYWAVREAVSLMDVSTLGKMIVSGPNALNVLEKIYPTNVSTIRTGRSRYVLLLNERGYIIDDGLIAKESDTRYTLTFTSGGSSFAEMWLRDWAGQFGGGVHILNQTYALGAINVTGPLSKELLRRAGVEKPPRYMRHKRVDVAGVPCHLFRLSFTGELSFELHHPAGHSVELWQNLMALGQDLGIKPHGLETLLLLRLEKGHVIVGQDTDFDSTPRRIHHDWMAKLDKEYFIGHHALVRTNRIPLDKQLVGFEMDGPRPIEGAVMWHNGEYAGYVTSSGYSQVLGKSVMLGWLYLFDGEMLTEVMIDGRTARRVPVPFYDKEGGRARA